MAQSKGHYVAMAQDEADLLMKVTEEGIRPFTSYLWNVLKTLKNKEVSCYWEPLETDRWQIKPISRLYEIQPETLIELQPHERGWFQVESEELLSDEVFDPDPEEAILIGRGRDALKVKLNGSDVRRSGNGDWELRLKDIDPSGKPVMWSGYNLTLKKITYPIDADSHEFSSLGHRINSRTGNGKWRFWLGADIGPEQSLEVNGIKCNYKVIKRFDNTAFKQKFPDSKPYGNAWKVCSKGKPSFSCTNVIDITEQEMKKLSLQELLSENEPLNGKHWKIVLEKNELYVSPINYKINSFPKEINHAEWREWLFSCHFQPAKDKWIQLVEPDYADEESASDSILDHFFGDQIRLHDSENQRFSNGRELYILKRRPEERQLLLSQEPKGKSSLPRGPQIHVQVDTKQILNQMDALRKLLDHPFPENLPLIELFKPRDKKIWSTFAPAKIDEWQVLNDLSFDGCDRQREFVSKALATPDFAILDGPPGTGKTTTILELILQLVKQDKRILLAASTHAAINNVLERLQEGAYTELVHATRVGLEDRAIGLEDFVLDNQVEQWKRMLNIEESTARQIVIDSANLICGTTMGLHRLFRDQNLKIDSNGPSFDVMIIDECSKTTFQEFIVPARLAKKWILVGDIRQLSPFTDREQITANLENLILPQTSNVTLSTDLQEACKLLQVLYPYRDKLIVPAHVGVIQELIKEISARKESKGYSGSGELNNLVVIKDEDKLVSNIHILYGHPVVIIEQSLLTKYHDWMPRDAIILEPTWLQTAHAAQHCASNKWNSGHNYHFKRKVLNEAYEVYQCVFKDITSKRWSAEICWRLEREYWLRFADDPRKEKWLKRDLDQLFPTTQNVRGKIYTIRNIAFPSILESLSDDGMEKRKIDVASTINQGFYKHERDCRHTTLTYQHRMHPDISKVPRELFYASTKGRKARSLLDGSKVHKKREWSYSRYKNHRVWLDIKGWVRDNENEDEAMIVSKEIEEFCKWARENPKAEDLEWEIAVLTFYRGQEKCLRKHLRKLTGQNTSYSRFEKDGIKIKLATVDFFQGQEADIVFLSMVNTSRDGFLDSPNRLNVSITRARFQLVIVGNYDYFASTSRTRELTELAQKTKRFDRNGN